MQNSFDGQFLAVEYHRPNCRMCVAVKLRTVNQPYMMVKYQLISVGSGMEWLISINIVTCLDNMATALCCRL